MFLEEESEEKVENTKGSEALIGKLLETRQIMLSGEVNKALAEKIVNQLLILESNNDDPIYVFIDSPGGDVDSGYAIFDMMRFIKAPVYTIGMGLVASAGALIFLAAPKDRRIALPNSHYLIHQPLSGMRGVATDIEIHAQELEKAKEEQVQEQNKGVIVEEPCFEDGYCDSTDTIKSGDNWVKRILAGKGTTINGIKLGYDNKQSRALLNAYIHAEKLQYGKTQTT